MLPIISLSLFVFWLVSFPMGGPLLHDIGYFPFFLLGHISGFFLIASIKGFFLRTFPFFIPATAILTAFFPVSDQTLRPLLMLLIGFLSSSLAVYVGVILTNSVQKKDILGLGIGNIAMVFLSNIPVRENYKFLILSIAPVLSLTKKSFEISSENIPLSLWLRFLPGVFILYLTGGLMYGVLMEAYRKEALLYGIEVIFYASAVFLCVILLKDWDENLLILSVVSFALGYFLMHTGNGLGLNLAMYAVQIGFGFADVFLLYTLIKLRNPIKAFPVGFGVVCSAILVGYFLFKIMEDTRSLIALGNLILVGFSVYLVHANRANRRGLEEVSQKSEDVHAIENIPHTQKSASPEGFLQELCRKRQAYKKTLSKREGSGSTTA